MRGSILEENIARTIGSIGESVAAGAIFTIPAFVIAGRWLRFDTLDAYLKSSALMIVGGLLGILFVTLLRRVMVEDPELGVPRVGGGSEIHKAGQQGARAAKFLFQAMGVGGARLRPGRDQAVRGLQGIRHQGGQIGASFVRLGTSRAPSEVDAGGTISVAGPGISPAYIGVGYIIGPRLASLNFAGGLLAWGLFAPLLMYFLGPQLVGSSTAPAGHGRCGLGRHDAQRLEVHRPADRRRRHAGGRRLHALQDAEEPDRRDQAVDRRRAEGDRPGAADIRLEKDLNIRLVLAVLAATVVLHGLPV